MNSKQRRKAERAGITIHLVCVREGVTEATHDVMFKRIGPGKYTCGGHSISFRPRHEAVINVPEKYFFFEESRRVCDDLSEIGWFMEYEYYMLWEYVRDK